MNNSIAVTNSAMDNHDNHSSLASSLLVIRQVATDAQNLPGEEDLQLWANAAFERGNNNYRGGEIIIRLVDEDESQSLNAEYRGKDKSTNVLSFVTEAPEGIPLEQLSEDIGVGDLVICAAVVSREASEQNKSETAHWAHMVVHGVLHLLGYDHLNDDEAHVMETLEQEVMAKLGFDDPYQDISSKNSSINSSDSVKHRN